MSEMLDQLRKDNPLHATKEFAVGHKVATRTDNPNATSQYGTVIGVRRGGIMVKHNCGAIKEYNPQNLIHNTVFIPSPQHESYTPMNPLKAALNKDFSAFESMITKTLFQKAAAAVEAQKPVVVNKILGENLGFSGHPDDEKHIGESVKMELPAFSDREVKPNTGWAHVDTQLVRHDISIRNRTPETLRKAHDLVADAVVSQNDRKSPVTRDSHSDVPKYIAPKNGYMSLEQENDLNYKGEYDGHTIQTAYKVGAGPKSKLIKVTTTFNNSGYKVPEDGSPQTRVSTFKRDPKGNDQ